jgi:uncharacterized protein YciI
MSGSSERRDRSGTLPVSDRPLVFKQPLWAIITENVVGPEEAGRYRDAYRAHQAELEKAGIIFGAGPLAELDGTRVGRGLVIIRANDAEEAMEIANSDPMFRAGIRKLTVYQWQLAEGHIQITLNFSNQDYRIE